MRLPNVMQAVSRMIATSVKLCLHALPHQFIVNAAPQKTSNTASNALEHHVHVNSLPSLATLALPQSTRNSEMLTMCLEVDMH